MQPALRRQFQPIALRIIAESGGEAEIADIRRAIEARHPDLKWDRRYPLQVLEDNGIITTTTTHARLAEDLDADQIASLLLALDERSVRTAGLRVENSSWRPNAPEWAELRRQVIETWGERCSVPGCAATTDLELDHIMRGSVMAAAGWSPAAINDPVNLQLLCREHDGAKTSAEARVLRLGDQTPPP